MTQDSSQHEEKEFRRHQSQDELRIQMALYKTIHCSLSSVQEAVIDFRAKKTFSIIRELVRERNY